MKGKDHISTRLTINSKKKRRDEKNCCICLDSIQKKSEFILCKSNNFTGHFFHKRCINRWKKRSSECPICRQPVIIFIREKILKQKKAFNSIDKNFINDKEVVLHCLFFSSPNLFITLPDFLKLDKDVLNITLKNYLSHYKDQFGWLDSIPNKWKKDKEFIQEIVRVRPANIEYADWDIRSDKEFIIQSLLYCSTYDKMSLEVNIPPFNDAYKNSYLIKFLPDIIFKDFFFWKGAVKKNPYSIFIFNDIVDIFTNDQVQEIYKEALVACPSLLRFLQIDFQQNKSFILLLVSIDGLVYKYLNNDFKHDLEIIKKAISNNPYTYRHIESLELKENDDIIRFALIKDGSILKYVPIRKINKQLVLLASKTNGFILNFLKNTKELRSFTKDVDIVKDCFFNDQDSFFASHYSLRDDMNFILSIFEDDRFNSKKVKNFSNRISYNLKDNEDLMRIFIEHYPSSFLNCSQRLKHDLNFIKYSLEKDIENIQHLSCDMLKKIKMVVF